MKSLFSAKYPKDWRILLGIIVTLSWLILGYLYISTNVGMKGFIYMPIDDMGTFLEGAFAPLAFMWLVIGLFIQQSVLAQNNEELRRNNLHSEKQTQAIAATELNARQETFFKIAENTRRQLGSISGMLFISSQGPLGSNKYTGEEISDLWQQFASGDYELFSRIFLTNLALDMEGSDLKVLFYGTDIRRKHSHNFIVGFDRLIKLAKDCDQDNIILDSMLYTAHGLLDSQMRDAHPDKKFEKIKGTDTDTYIEDFFDSCNHLENK
jgi:hypothetical protein